MPMKKLCHCLFFLHKTILQSSVELAHRVGVKTCFTLISSVLVSLWWGKDNTTWVASLLQPGKTQKAAVRLWPFSPDWQHLPPSQPGPESKAIHAEMREFWGTSR